MVGSIYVGRARQKSMAVHMRIRRGERRKSLQIRERFEAESNAVIPSDPYTTTSSLAAEVQADHAPLAGPTIFLSD
jgi:hypothetical protein